MRVRIGCVCLPKSSTSSVEPCQTPKTLRMAGCVPSFAISLASSRRLSVLAGLSEFVQEKRRGGWEKYWVLCCRVRVVGSSSRTSFGSNLHAIVECDGEDLAIGPTPEGWGRVSLHRRIPEGAHIVAPLDLWDGKGGECSFFSLEQLSLGLLRPVPE